MGHDLRPLRHMDGAEVRNDGKRALVYRSRILRSDSRIVVQSNYVRIIGPGVKLRRPGVVLHGVSSNLLVNFYSRLGGSNPDRYGQVRKKTSFDKRMYSLIFKKYDHPSVFVSCGSQVEESLDMMQSSLVTLGYVPTRPWMLVGYDLR